MPETLTVNRAETLRNVAKLYYARKREDRSYSIKQLSKSIGIGYITLYRAILDKQASANTVKVLSEYLELHG